MSRRLAWGQGVREGGRGREIQKRRRAEQSRRGRRTRARLEKEERAADKDRETVVQDKDGVCWRVRCISACHTLRDTHTHTHTACSGPSSPHIADRVMKSASKHAVLYDHRVTTASEKDPTACENACVCDQ